jgi:3-oxoacyl-[acyl-carrier-protein] synthase-3
LFTNCNLILFQLFNFNNFVQQFQIDAGGLIGDGAAAVILTKSKPEEKSALTKFLFGTYSEGTDYTSIRSGGSEYHPNHIYTPSNYMYFDMNGKKILEFTIAKLIRVLEDYQVGITSGNLENIDWIVPHQASYAAFHAMVSYCC